MPSGQSSTTLPKTKACSVLLTRLKLEHLISAQLNFA